MRTWFSFSPLTRAVRGSLIIDLQIGLTKAGCLVGIDGIYATQTKKALQEWQTKNAANPSGDADELTWRTLTDTPSPSLFRRCLSLTAAFEGHGYTLAVGDFDGAYLTWGIIGFTLKSRSLGDVVNRIEAQHAGLIASAIGPDKAAELLRIVGASESEREVWADAISTGVAKYLLRDDWRDAFEALGNRSEVRAIQDEVARDVYWSRAIEDLRDHGEMTELDAALFFDTAVQNGGVDSAKAAAISDALAGLANPTTRTRLSCIATAIAAISEPSFQADVLSRRETIAAGTGTVHGAAYRIENWGLSDVAITPADLT